MFQGSNLILNPPGKIRRAKNLTSCQKHGITIGMKAMAVGEIKTHFSEILKEVKNGKKVGILYGKTKKPIAMIVPYSKGGKGERKIGILDGKIKIEFTDDFEMTTEELLGIQ
jgi:antitoxin (DNA-binding transcriptional repressor) of toxin-antitoxin stability system